MTRALFISSTTSFPLLLEQLAILLPGKSAFYAVGTVYAGFPSPADDFLESSLDLNEHLVSHKAATFFLRASGNGFNQFGIFNHDLLIVDRSLTPEANDIIIAHHEGNLILRQFPKQILKSIKVMEAPLEVWGVVVYVIHYLKTKE